MRRPITCRQLCRLFEQAVLTLNTALEILQKLAFVVAFDGRFLDDAGQPISLWFFI